MTMTLNESKVALLLRHAPERFEAQVEYERDGLAREWIDADDDRAERIQAILDNDVYDFEQIGWEIVYDGDEYVMAVVTPVPDWRDDDLDEHTRRFVHDWKEETLATAEDMRESTGLRPRVFVATMLLQSDDFEMGTEEAERVATALGYSQHGLEELLDHARDEIEQATTLCKLTDSVA